MTGTERRIRRSHDTSQALFYQLETSRSRANLQAMVLADDDGLCVASSGDDDMCDELSAYMTLIGDKVERFDGCLLDADGRWDVYIRRFNVFGVDLYVGAVGGTREGRTREVGHSMRGTGRILSS